MTHRCAITCAEPGCQTRIPYDADSDIMIPLYCEKHRSKSGRHAGVRLINQKPNEVKPQKWVVMICPKCKKRQNQLHEEWVSGEPVKCVCGVKMIYHKDLEPGNE